MKKGILCVLFLAILLPGRSQITIQKTLFGGNAWEPDTIGDVNNCPGGAANPCLLGGQLHKTWKTVKSSNMTTMRYSGVNPDVNGPTIPQYKRMIDSMQNKGITPIMIIPFNNGNFKTSDATKIVNGLKTLYPGLWYTIGNEPNGQYPNNKYAKQIGVYIKAFSQAIKGADPTAKVMGPELSFYDFSIVDSLFNTGFSDYITGLDGNGKPYIDAFTVHTYPFDGTQNRPKIVANSWLNQFIPALAAKCSTATANYRSAYPLLYGVTEININTTNPASNTATGYGSAGFLAGQWLSDCYSVAMQNGVSFMCPWSTVESAGSNDLGVLDQSLNPRPDYYHYQMVTQLSGNYTNLNSSTNNSYVKAFAGKNTDSLRLIILNEDSLTDFKYSFAPNTITLSSSPATYTFKDTVPYKSTSFLVFDLSGNLTRRCRYKEGDAAPRCTTLICNHDLWAKDSPSDNGVEPSGSSTDSAYWKSQDIWVRDTTEKKTSTSPTVHYANEHSMQNPSWYTYGSNKPDVYVSVRNRGCYTDTARVAVYWTNANAGRSWDHGSGVHWKLIDTSGIVIVPPGLDGTAKVHWNNLPNPLDSTNRITYKSHHYCLIARILTKTGDPIKYDPAGDVYQGLYVRNNNNVVWRNVDIIDSTNRADGIIVVGNGTGVLANSLTAELDFKFIGQEADPFINHGVVDIDLGPVVFAKWVQGGMVSHGVISNRDLQLPSLQGLLNSLTGDLQAINIATPLNATSIRVISTDASIGNLSFGQNEEETVNAQFTFSTNAPAIKQYSFDLIEKAQINGTGPIRVIAGENYLINPPTCVAPVISATTIGTSVRLAITQPANTITGYQWQMNGQNITGSTNSQHIALGTGDYNLVVFYTNGCAMPSNLVHVQLGPPLRKGATEPVVKYGEFSFTIYPNPVSSVTNLSFNLPTDDVVSIGVFDINGRKMLSLVSNNAFSAGQHTVELNTENFGNGIYFIHLSSNDYNKVERLSILK